MAQELLNQPAEKVTGRVDTREPAQDKSPLRANGNDRIVHLQRTLGNCKLAELMRSGRISRDGRLIPMQARLVVGAADDPLEHEAERVAEQVVSTPESAVASFGAGESSQAAALVSTAPVNTTTQSTPGATSQPERKEPQKTKERDEEDEDAVMPLQRELAQAGGDSFEAGPGVETQLNASKGRGSPLTDHLRAYMEPRFGVDFGQVRVHTGAAAEKMNEAVGAQAFTHESEIYYGAGHHPGELALTAHELTHVVQQGGAVKLKSVQRSCEACHAGGTPCPNCAEKHEEQEDAIRRSTALADPPVSTAPPLAEPAAASGPPSATQGSQSSLAKPPSAAASPTTGTQGAAQTSGLKQAPAAAKNGSSAAPPSGAAGATISPSASPAAANADPTSAGGAGTNPAKGASAPTNAPAAAIDTSSAEGLLTSLAAAPASAFGQALTLAAAAASGVEAREKSDLGASLPEIDQPTGLPVSPVKRDPKRAAVSTLPPGRVAEPAPQTAGAVTAAPALPVATGPLPAAHVSTAAAEPAQDAGGSWWDWLTGKVRSFLSCLPTSDSGLSTSAGKRPTVSLSGEADPAQNAEYARTSGEEVGTHVAAADAATTKDFGEHGIAPTLATQKLRSKNKPSAAAGVKGAHAERPHALSAADLAEFDAGATPLVSAKVQEQVEKRRQDQEVYHKKSDDARADGEKQIAEQDDKARVQQETLRTQARAEVDTGREQWRAENRKIHENFSAQSSAKHVEVDRQIKDKAKSADDQAEKELADAEKKADAERTKADAKAEAKKKEADDKPQSWWEGFKGAVSSAFDSIKAAINDIFDELRSLVKSIIDKAKSLVAGLIELARSAIVGFIKAFGEFVKGLVSIALAAFPEAAAKARAWIDDKVERATAAVNKAAEVLKAAAEAILDAVGKVLDAALAVLQASFNLAFNALELLAKLPFMAMDALGKLVDLLTHFGPFLDGAKKIMDDPSVITEGIKTSIGGMIAQVPAAANEKVEALAAQFGGDAKVATPAATQTQSPAAHGPATQASVLQRSPDPTATTAPAKRHVPVAQHLKGIWRHLTGGLDHLKSSWWEELKKVGWNLLWPWPAVWSDLKDIWAEIKTAWASVKELKVSAALDSVLTIGQKINSVLGNLYGWFFIASVLIGTIIGAFFGGAGAVPGFMAGVAVASEVGEGLLVGLLAVEGSVIVKGIADLAIGNDKAEDDEKDYDKIAGSTLTLAITGAMMVVGEIAAKLAKSVWEGAASLLRGEKAPEVDVKLDAPDAKGTGPDKATDPENTGPTNEPPELIDGERVTAQSQDGHVKVTESGRCLVCSTCEEIGIRFRDEIKPGSDFETRLNDAKAIEDPKLKEEAIEKLDKDLSDARQKTREGETPEQKTQALSDLQTEARSSIDNVKEKLADPVNEAAWKANPQAKAEIEAKLQDLESEYADAVQSAKEAAGDPKATDVAREKLDNIRTQAELLKGELEDAARGPAKSPTQVKMDALKNSGTDTAGKISDLKQELRGDDVSDLRADPATKKELERLEASLNDIERERVDLQRKIDETLEAAKDPELADEASNDAEKLMQQLEDLKARADEVRKPIEEKLEAQKEAREVQRQKEEATRAAQERVDKAIEKIKDRCDATDGTETEGDFEGKDPSTESILEAEIEQGRPLGRVPEGHYMKVNEAVGGLKNAIDDLEQARPTINDPATLKAIDEALERANDRIPKLSDAFDKWQQRSTSHPKVWDEQGLSRVYGRTKDGVTGRWPSNPNLPKR